MKKVIYIFLMIMMHWQGYALFTQDRAAYLMQKGEYDKAKSLLQKMVVDSPDNPEILYDAGIASYRTNEPKQSVAYFKQAAMCPNACSQLKEKAYFNGANAAVALKDYPAAIADYKKVLTFNPNNERAQHNLKKIEEMLEQQKQEQQQKNEKNKEKQQDKNNKKNQSEKDKKSEQNQEEKDTSKQDQQKENESQNEKDNETEKEDKQQSNESEHDEQQQTRQKQDREKEQPKEHNTSENKEQESTSNDTSDREKNEEQKASEAEKNKQAENNTQAQTQHNSNNEEQKIAPYLTKILEEQEKKDAASHKMMIKAAVNKDMAGYHGQNNW